MSKVFELPDEILVQIAKYVRSGGTQDNINLCLSAKRFSGPALEAMYESVTLSGTQLNPSGLVLFAAGLLDQPSWALKVKHLNLQVGSWRPIKLHSSTCPVEVQCLPFSHCTCSVNLFQNETAEYIHSLGHNFDPRAWQDEHNHNTGHQLLYAALVLAHTSNLESLTFRMCPHHGPCDKNTASGRNPDLHKLIVGSKRLRFLDVWPSADYWGYLNLPALETVKLRSVIVGDLANIDSIECSAKTVHTTFNFLRRLSRRRTDSIIDIEARSSVKSLLSRFSHCRYLYLTCPDHTYYKLKTVIHRTSTWAMAMRVYILPALSQLSRTLETLVFDSAYYDGFRMIAQIRQSSSPFPLSLKQFAKLRNLVAPIGFFPARGRLLEFLPPSMEAIEILYIRVPGQRITCDLGPLFADAATDFPRLKWVAVYIDTEPRSNANDVVQLESLEQVLRQMAIPFGIFDLHECPKLSSRVPMYEIS